MVKKLFAAMIITVTLIGGLGISHVAAETKQDSALPFLTAIGVVTADVTDLNQPMSREEFAFYLAKILRIDEQTDSQERYFKDVDYNGYTVGAINALTRRGIISVSDEKLFRPKEQILYEEACKMLIYALEYNEIAAYRAGNHVGYPARYVQAATQIGIKGGTIGKKMDLGLGFAMLKDAMEIEIPVIDTINAFGDIVYKVDSDKSILSEYWDIYSEKGTISAVYGSSLFGDVVSEPDEVLFNKQNYMSENMKPEEFFGEYVKAYYRMPEPDDCGTIVYVESISRTENITIKPEDVTEVTGTKVKYCSQKGKQKELTLQNPAFVYNGVPLESDISKRLTSINKGSVVIKDRDNNGIYDTVIVEDYANFVVSSMNDTMIYNKIKQGDIIQRDGYDYTIIMATDGTRMEYSDIQQGHVLSVAKSLNGKRIKILVSSEQISGTVTAMGKQDNTWMLTIAEKEYPVEKSYTALSVENEAYRNSLISQGKTLLFKVDSFGNIVYIADQSSNLKSGYIIKGYYDENADAAYIKLLTEEGGIDRFELAQKPKINGKSYKKTEKALCAIPGYNPETEGLLKQQFIRYMMDEENKIKQLDTAVYSNDADCTKMALRAIYEEDQEVWYNSGRLGARALMNDQTQVFLVPYGQTDFNEEDCGVITYTAFMLNDANYICNAYHFSASSVFADAAVIYYRHEDFKDNKERYRPTIMVSDIYRSINDDDEPVSVLVGYSRGTKTEYIIPDDISLDGVEEGDVIMLNHSIDGKIISGSKIGKPDITIVIKRSALYENNRPGWTGNKHHDYLYSDSAVELTDYYRANFQMSFGYVSKVSGNAVAWSYNDGTEFSEAANLTGNITIYDSNRREGERIYVGKAENLVTYGEAGMNCSKIILRINGGVLWDTIAYN